MIEPLLRPRPDAAERPEASPFAYVWHDVVEELRFSGSWRSDQIGVGLLVGHHYRDPEDQSSYVEVDGFIAGTHVPDASTFSRHLRQEWRAAGASVRAHFGEAEVLGWYVSAPTAQVPGHAELVLHNTFFNHPWQVGLWLQPGADPLVLRSQAGAFVQRPAGILRAPPQG
ncbi:MAG: hypothetical protein H6702_01585 [Myxococcales bacterium]|nr:hypothetical protein [Myxococcales bacterium]